MTNRRLVIRLHSSAGILNTILRNVVLFSSVLLSSNRLDSNRRLLFPRLEIIPFFQTTEKHERDNANYKSKQEENETEKAQEVGKRDNPRK